MITITLINMHVLINAPHHGLVSGHMCDMTLHLTDKCLAPYYGGCDYTKECMNSRYSVSCGGCLPGFVEIPGETSCSSESKILTVEIRWNRLYMTVFQL